MAVAVEVRGVLRSEREAKIERAITRAWQDWRDDPLRAMYSRWPRTRANMVFERIADRLQEEFADDPRVQFHFQDETIKVVFDDLVLARFKKADDERFWKERPDAGGYGILRGASRLAGFAWVTESRDPLSSQRSSNLYSRHYCSG